MSEPRNHHYVSQSLSSNFMSSEGVMYKYNKEGKWISKVKSTKSLFSQPDLNSIIGENGEVDHSSVETELNQNFETHFPKHHKILIDAAYSNQEVGKVFPNSDEIDEAIEYVIGMALIGHARHPQKIEESNNAIIESLKTVLKNATPELKKQFEEFFSGVADVKNKIPLDFKNLKDGIRRDMGEVRYGIVRAPENHYFILPDCSSGIKRFQIENNSPATEIGIALMPLSSKILISAISRRLLDDKLGSEPSGFHDITESLAMSYNRILYDNAYHEVACENKEFLEKFIATL